MRQLFESGKNYEASSSAAGSPYILQPNSSNLFLSFFVKKINKFY